MRGMAASVAVVALVGSVWCFGAVPATPTNFRHTGNTVDSVTWAWGDASTDETGFVGHDNSEAVKWTVGPNVTSYTETGLTVNTQQYRRHVHAFNASGNSARSSRVSVYTSIEPCTGVVFGAVTVNSIEAASANVPTGLTRGTSGILIRNTTNATDSGWHQNNNYWASGSLVANKAYQFTAQSRNGDGDTAPESPAWAKYTLPVAPNVTCDRSTGTGYPRGTVFTFTNAAGWADGGVNHYHYIVDSNPTTAPADGSLAWSSGTLAIPIASAGDWYLHVMSHNPEQASGGVQHYGPYVINGELQPNPMTWAQQPRQMGTSTISMQAGGLTGGVPPYEYEFGFVDSPTGGAGGSDSGWQSGATYADTGLEPNHQYRYQCRGRDTETTTGWATVVAHYTDIEACSGVSFGTVTATSIAAFSTNTPSGLARGSSGVIVRNVTTGSSSAWKQNNDPWLSDALTANKAYQFTAQSRNGDGDLTPETGAATRYTLPVAPIVTCDKPAGIVYQLGAKFTFTNVTGWGEGSAAHYHYEFDTNATTTPTGASTSWTSGTVVRTPGVGTWYLHVVSHNPEEASGGVSHCGPFIVVPPTVALSVQSSPDAGVPIVVSPVDENGQGDGNTSFARTYKPGVSVTLTAPALHNGAFFFKWTRDGSDLSTSRTVMVTMDADSVMMAVYAGVLADAEAGLAGAGACSLAWGDIDNDGDLDLAVAGCGADGPISRIYRNDAGRFTDIQAGLVALGNCALAWGDYDNDGDLDLAIAGYNEEMPDPYIARIYRNDGGSFSDIQAGLPGVGYCALAWGDVDNDGDLDLVIAGYSEQMVPGSITRVYRNDGGVFTPINTGISGVSECALALADFDNDGDLDLAIAGYTRDTEPGACISKVYRNDGNWSFTDTGAGLVAVYCCALAWGDLDDDGMLDLTIAGYSECSGGGMAITRVYRNVGGAFVDAGAGLAGLEYCSLAWGDYDGDGDADLAAAGWAGTDRCCKVYRNDAGVLHDSNLPLMGVSDCSLAWGDYDGDGRLDLAVAGWQLGGCVSSVYRNNGQTFNAPPTAPTRLDWSVNGHDVTLRWGPATDDKTPPAGLSYNLRVGTTPGGGDILSGMADASSGRRRVAATGNAQKCTCWMLYALPNGTYYWSVQAADAGFAASAWAPEQVLQFDRMTLTVIGGSGSGIYEPGTVVPIVADVPEGCRFIRWTGGTADVADVNSPSTTITMHSNATITAEIVELYTLTVVGGSGSGVYDEGELVAIQADPPAQGYYFLEWQGDTDNLAEVNSAATTITMLADATVTAAYARKPVPKVVNLSIVPSSTTITPAQGGQFYFDVVVDVVERCNGLTLWGVVTRQGQAQSEVTFSYAELLPGVVDAAAAAGARLMDVSIPGDDMISYGIAPANPNDYGPTIRGAVARFHYNYAANARGTYELKMDETPVTDGDAWSTRTAFGRGTGISVAWIPTWVFFSGERVDFYILNFGTSTVTFVDQLRLTVNNGTGSGSYPPGAAVPIHATVPDGYRFNAWTGDTAQVADVNAASTTITMVADATVTATFSLLGDANGDDCVNVSDLLIVRNSLGKSGSGLPGDVCDDDSVVNIADLLYVRNRMGAGSCR